MLLAGHVHILQKTPIGHFQQLQAVICFADPRHTGLFHNISAVFNLALHLHNGAQVAKQVRVAVHQIIHIINRNLAVGIAAGVNAHLNNVSAQAAEHLVHLVHQALANAHNRNNRRHADNNAQHSQNGAQLASHQAFERHLKRLLYIH